MTNVIDLFAGIGVMIDDALSPEKSGSGDQIWKIKSSFEEANTPLLTFTELPDDKIVHFNSISFLLLDWDLIGLEIGIDLPPKAIEDNIEFLKSLRNNYFGPIFIFSNEDPSSIISKLTEEGLYKEGKSNYIFVKRKSEVDDSSKLFEAIENWIKTTPSIYVLKEWELTLKKAKNNLFWDFYEISSDWPEILQKSFENDGVNKHYELNSLIYKNLLARTFYVSFDDEILKVDDESITKEDLRKILECERFLTKDLPDNTPATGDIFKITGQSYKYLINVRPDCDILRKGEDVMLYCLKGKVLKESKINIENSGVVFKHGSFIEKVNNTYIAFIDNGKIVEFKFEDTLQLSWAELKAKRIGRLLPPYISRVQQKYTFYLQRQALPAIPDKAII